MVRLLELNKDGGSGSLSTQAGFEVASASPLDAWSGKWRYQKFDFCISTLINIHMFLCWSCIILPFELGTWNAVISPFKSTTVEPILNFWVFLRENWLYRSFGVI